MIVTVTPNPSLDRTLHVRILVPGGLHRALAESVEPSGKGVNVALALQGAGVPVTAVLPVGGHAGSHLVSMLAGLPHVAVRIAGSVRSNVTLVEDDGTTTKVNEAGPVLGAEEADRLQAAALAAGSPADWVAWCGSLPPGFGPDRLAGAVRQARATGRLVAVDTSGAALAAVLSGPREAMPHLVKPNTAELAEVTGRPLRTLGDVAGAAAGLVSRGVDSVLVSLGGDGALLVRGGVALHGRAPVARVVNTAGAGDALLAGYLASPSISATQDADRLASALRFGAAAVQHQGTLFAAADATQPVTVELARRETVLREPITDGRRSR